MKRQLMLAVTLFVTSCVNSSSLPDKSAQGELSRYKTLHVAMVRFIPPPTDARFHERNFVEKVKTEIFRQGMGQQYVEKPQKDSLLINIYVTELKDAPANLRMLFPGIAESNVAGIIELTDASKTQLKTWPVKATSVGGFVFSGFVDTNGLMNNVSADTVTKIKYLIGAPS